MSLLKTASLLREEHEDVPSLDSDFHVQVRSCTTARYPEEVRRLERTDETVMDR